MAIGRVVQGLRDLARVTNFNHRTLAALAAQVQSLPAVPSIAQIRQSLQVSGGSPLNITQLVPSNDSGNGAVHGVQRDTAREDICGSSVNARAVQHIGRSIRCGANPATDGSLL